MVLRTDLLNTIGLIAALLLPLTKSNDNLVHTNPMALGIVMKCFSNISYFANLYSLISTLSASYYAIAYEVYGDIWRPLFGLMVAFASLMCEQLLQLVIVCFELVDEANESAYKLRNTYRSPWSVPMFTIGIVPFVVMLLAILESVIAQRLDARQHHIERKREGLPAVDGEKRRRGDPFNRGLMSTNTPYILARRS